MVEQHHVDVTLCNQSLALNVAGETPSGGSARHWIMHNGLFDEHELNRLEILTDKCITLVASTQGAYTGNNATLTPIANIDLAHNHSLILTSSVTELNECLQRYITCKNKAPATTSAIIIKPKRLTQHAFTELFRHMTLLREYPINTCHIMGTPNSKAIQAWLDRPTELKAGKLIDSSSQLTLTGTQSCLDFIGTFAGQKGRIKVDTGASDSFISTDFVSKAKLATTPCNRAVALADGKTVQARATCCVRMQLEKHTDVVPLYVLQLGAEYDVILGVNWLRKHSVVLDFETNTLTIKNGTRSFTAKPPPTTATDVLSPGGGELLPIEKLTLSALQVKKAARKGKQMYLAYVTKLPASNDSNPANNTVTTTVTSSPPLQPRAEGLLPEVKLKTILEKYKQVFEDMPGGNIKRPGITPMTIQLEPGKSPPVGITYRLSQPEYLECERLIKEGLEKGLIEPSSSPFGAPVLFVPKPRGAGIRMCCDYRALNKITIKNSYPLPRIDDLLDRLKGATIFSAIDLQSGYNQLYIHPDDCHKTAFRSPFGLYQWRVVPFGLTNAPAYFARAMQQMFGDLIGKCVFVYLDDILVFSKSPEEHEQHLDLVLARLQQYQLYARLPKCHFNMPEVEYLGHVVGREGIKVDQRKIQIIKDWPTPKTQNELRSFLGLANYFRRFIHAYSTIARPLHALTGSTVKWHSSSWTGACQQAFDTLKSKLITAPILSMPDFTKPFEVIADASLHAIGAILLQDGKPIAFESRKLSPAESNYDTTEREMVAVIHALTVWRCYLDGMQFTIYSDHEPLKYLRTKPSLTPRQVRWSQFMERFNYTWEFRAGKLNAADPLSRATHAPYTGSPNTHTVTHLAAVSRKLCKKTHTQDKIVYPPPPPLIGKDKEADWLMTVQAAYKQDEQLVSLQKKNKLQLKGEYYYHGDMLYIPKALRTKCLEEMHDTPLSGHKGITKTMESLSRLYWWPGITADATQYVKSCLLCQRNKASTQKPGGLLQPLPVPNDTWSEVTMDFIVGLPCTPRGFDAIMVMCDRLSKMVKFALCHTTTDAPAAARLFRDHVICNHGTPEIIISDRDTRFTSQFWHNLTEQLGCKLKLSTAFHPQTDGQTERANRVLEEYLRHYINPHQSDWDEWLPLAEFAYNNSHHEAIGTTPFYMNYGKHPRLPSGPSKPARFPAVTAFVKSIQDIVSQAKTRLQAARDRAKHYADKQRRDFTLQQGQRVLLSTKFIQLKVPGANKLLPKYIGPFNVKDVLSEVSYRLELPECMKCHNVFHLSLLKPYVADPNNRFQPPPPPFEFNEEEGLWYEIEGILAHKVTKLGNQRIMQYLVSFKGYGAEHNKWCDASGVTKAAKDEYHARTNTSPNVSRYAVKATKTTTKRRHVQHTTPTTPTPTTTPPGRTTRSGRIVKRVRFT